MSVGDQALNAWFHATVPRSAGFNSLDVSSMTDASTLVTMILMFIGGGSLSTAGGIKVGTFIIVVLSVITFYAVPKNCESLTTPFPRPLHLKL